MLSVYTFRKEIIPATNNSYANLKVFISNDFNQVANQKQNISITCISNYEAIQAVEYIKTNQ